jgi:amidase
MSVKPPTLEQVRDAARELGLALSDGDAAEFRSLLADALEVCYRPLDELPDPMPFVRYPRTPGRRPEPDEDPLHAWYVKTSIQGAPEGKLAGKRVAVKDAICVAGVPMMNGGSVLEGYVPDVDATVVQRVLDAGGEIAGKAHCEYFCFSAGSHTNSTGATHNPHRRGFSAGGSSSGCAALVGAGEVEMAIGGDQGGSIREPSAFCGVYGLKPTYGLVPYTGAAPMEMTLDHLGPMTATVADNALLLEVIAGEDPEGLDPRQRGVRTAPYTEALERGVAGMRIGVLEEGFGQPQAEPEVETKVRAAATALVDLGARVEAVSVPMHRLGMSVWLPIGFEGTVELMLLGNGLGTGWRGLYVGSLGQALAAWRDRADWLPEGLKLGMLLRAYAQRQYRGRYYAKAQNASRRLRAAYDRALADHDLLVLPTVPFKAPPLPAGRSRAEMLGPGLPAIANTAPFDCTGHPAMSVPVGLVDGLPVGMMLVARHWDEMAIYAAAAALERAGDWRSR